jgi:CBS domain-containing protein
MAKSIRDAMTKNPSSIVPSASVVEAAQLMQEQHIGSVPIPDDEQRVDQVYVPLTGSVGVDEGARRS